MTPRRFTRFRESVRAFCARRRLPNFTCDVCGAEVFGGERICRRCLQTLPVCGELRCAKCGRASGDALCSDCREMFPDFDRARSAFRHCGDAAKLVVRFKRGEKYLYEALAGQLLPLLAEFSDIDFLTHIPMTERAVRKRGYNQSRLIAEELSRLSGIPAASPIEKIRETDSQKFLNRRDRAVNLKGCFRVKNREEVKDKRILILDDTMTTGATLSEAARCLKRAGAAAVFALTVTAVEDSLSPPEGLFGKKESSH